MGGQDSSPLNPALSVVIMNLKTPFEVKLNKGIRGFP